MRVTQARWLVLAGGRTQRAKRAWAVSRSAAVKEEAAAVVAEDEAEVLAPLAAVRVLPRRGRVAAVVRRAAAVRRAAGPPRAKGAGKLRHSKTARSRFRAVGRAEVT